MSEIVNDVQKLIDIGFSYHQEGHLDDAEMAYKEALDIDNKNSEVYNLLGVLKLQQNDVISAINWIEKAIEITPEEYYYETLFQAYVRAGLYKHIVKREQEVLDLFPKNFALLFNVALANKKIKNYKTAISFYNKALNIDPSSAVAWYNLSHLYAIEGEAENALSALKNCHKINLSDDEVSYHLGLAYMKLKKYDKGLKLFENRLGKKTAIAIQKKAYPTKLTDANLWKGENIKDKTIYVYYESGFGDVIMFSRYIPLLAEKCKKIKFLPQKPLLPLFKLNNLGYDELCENFVPEPMMDFDVHVPLLSLPYLLGLKNDKVFPYSEGYIRYDKKLAEEFKKKYFETDKIKVGIKWQGNTFYDYDRVIPAKYFQQLMNVDNTQYYSFQTFEGSEDVKELNGIIDVGKDLLDFSQTAAALSNLDIVICNDTSLAHLAGAMGIPCWVILPYEMDWRWHNNIATCDWYDSVKLFHQHKLGDWQGVFDDLLNEMHD